MFRIVLFIARRATRRENRRVHVRSAGRRKAGGKGRRTETDEQRGIVRLGEIGGNKDYTPHDDVAVAGIRQVLRRSLVISYNRERVAAPVIIVRARIIAAIVRAVCIAFRYVESLILQSVGRGGAKMVRTAERGTCNSHPLRVSIFVGAKFSAHGAARSMRSRLWMRSKFARITALFTVFVPFSSPTRLNFAIHERHEAVCNCANTSAV